MDSVLLVCYSYTGVSRRAAQLLALRYGWPIGEIHDTDARGYLRCLLDSLLQRRPPISYQGPDPAGFRTVVLVSPVWAWRLAGPMRTFVASRREALQEVAVVTTMYGSGARAAASEISHLLGRPPVRAEGFTAMAIDDDRADARLLAFGQALAGSAPAAQPEPASATEGIEHLGHA
jgi:hypothetical protein